MAVFHRLFEEKFESCIVTQWKYQTVYSYSTFYSSESIEVLLEATQHNAYKWSICGELKVVGILMGIEGGFTKHCWFLCLWNSRTTKEHYIRRDWPVRESYLSGVANIENVPLVDPQNTLLSSLHIKLGLIKNFV